MGPRTLLLLSTGTIVTLWQLPYGHQVLYPLTLLATYAHEMGHGMTALLLGAEFDQLFLYADGSGLALWHGNPGRMATAAIAAGGLMGPTLAGVVLLLLSRSPRHARMVLGAVAVLIAASVLLWVRNAFGLVFLSACAATLAIAGRILPDRAAVFVLHLMAATLCLSWFSDLNYMFSDYAVAGGTRHPSDSAAIAAALWLPYWFWGGVVALVSLLLLVLGIAFAIRTPTHAPQQAP